MKLSFVIPAYNEEHYLGACLASILVEKKTAPCEVEIIVVDNASTDGTRKIAESYPGVTVVVEPRKGIVRARRAGFLASHGDLVANIDADTRLPPHWIEKAMREFSKDPGLAALSGPHVYYDLSRTHEFFVALYYRFAFLLYLLNRVILGKSSLIQGGNFVVRREALDAIGGYDTSIAFYGEDTDLARRLPKAGRVKFMLSFSIYASGRRMKSEGALRTGARYVINYIWVLVFKKPYHKGYTDVRLPPPK